MSEQNNAPAESKIEQIAALSDALRSTINYPRQNDRFVMTAGIVEMVGTLPQWPAFRRMREMTRIIMDYDAFTEDNNPDGERSFGIFEWQGVRCYWKIDYYNPTLDAGSEDPADPTKTARVLTVLRADEY